MSATGAGRLPEFLCALNTNEACIGEPISVAMRLVLLVFILTSELIQTPWAEIDLDKGGGSIHGHALSAGRVASSRQERPSREPVPAGSGLLCELHRHPGGGTHVLPHQEQTRYLTIQQ